MELIPAGDGLFEVWLDNELIYSKKRTGEFPEAQEIMQMIRVQLRKT